MYLKLHDTIKKKPHHLPPYTNDKVINRSNQTVLYDTCVTLAMVWMRVLLGRRRLSLMLKSGGYSLPAGKVDVKPDTDG